MSDRTPTHYLIILMGSLGDVIRGLSLPSRIKRSNPSCRITWVVEPKCEAIVRAHAGIDRVIVFPRRNLLGGARQFLSLLRSERYDVVLDLQRHAKSGIIGALSGGTRRIGFHPENCKELNWIFSTEQIEWISERIPKLAHYHRFLDYLGVPPMPHDFGLGAWAQNAPPLDTPVPPSAIGVVFTSTWRSKNWPESHYRDFLSRLAEQQRAPIVFLGDSSAKEISTRLSTDRVINLVGRTSLHQLAGVLSRLAVLVGPDSGPGHLASALGVPFVSIFGPTSPERVAFYGSESYVIRGSVGCAPCYRSECPGLGGVCLSSVTPDAVLEMVGRLMRSRARGTGALPVAPNSAV